MMPLECFSGHVECTFDKSPQKNFRQNYSKLFQNPKVFQKFFFQKKSHLKSFSGTLNSVSTSELKIFSENLKEFRLNSEIVNKLL